jgi:HSP20 family protein
VRPLLFRNSRIQRQGENCGRLPSKQPDRLVWAFPHYDASNFRIFLLAIQNLPEEEVMIENRIEKNIKPIPVPYEEFESFPKHVEEFFDMIARRPFELLEKRPLLFGRELEHLLRTEPEVARPILLRLYETEENLIVRAEVPGFTEKELNIVCEPWRVIVTGRKEIREEGRSEKREKEEVPYFEEKAHIYKTVKLPVEVIPEKVKALLKNGMLELTLPKAEVVKKVKIEVKPL